MPTLAERLRELRAELDAILPGWRDRLARQMTESTPDWTRVVYRVYELDGTWTDYPLLCRGGVEGERLTAGG